MKQKKTSSMEEIMNRQAKAWEKATNTFSIDN
jgi:hypothetical protein